MPGEQLGGGRHSGAADSSGPAYAAAGLAGVSLKFSVNPVKKILSYGE